MTANSTALDTKPGANNAARFEAQQKIRAKYMRGGDKGLEPFQLAAIMARQGCAPSNPYHVALDAQRIVKLARSLASLAVQHCNRGLSPRQEAREMNIAAEIKTIAAWYGLKASTSGDPRGYVVRLDGPGVPRNGWGDGFGVA